MSEQMKEQPPQEASLNNAEIVVLLKRIQQKLDFLEKKMETLLHRSQEKVFRPKPFSKPFRSFGPPQRHEKREYRGEYKSDYDRRPREGNSDEGRYAPKRRDDRGQKFDPKKKPFFNKRKDRG